MNELEGNVKIYSQKFQMTNDFCDVTLACEDKQIKQHKLIISSFSLVLRNILKSKCKYLVIFRHLKKCHISVVYIRKKKNRICL